MSEERVSTFKVDDHDDPKHLEYIRGLPQYDPEVTNPHTQAYLKSLGIDPRQVDRYGWDSHTYLEFQGSYDEEGEYVREHYLDWGDSIRVQREWPEEFHYPTFFAATLEELGDEG